MKKKLFSRLFKFGLPLVAVAVVPSVVSSCSSTVTTKTKVLNASNWNNGNVKYSELSSSNTSLESATFGSSFNSGNYIFIWGTLADSSFATFLYGSSGASATEEKSFENSTFLKSFFSSELSTSSVFGNVSLLLYIDTPPYNGDVTDNSAGETGYDSPTEQYTLDNVLKEANEGAAVGRYTAETLPLSYQLKVGNYMRGDKEAVTYREFVQYVKTVRPSVSGPENSGIIAFKKGKNPAAFSTSSTISDLTSYYTPSADDE
ncbi:hypothetical protein D8X55_03685 [Malacoplasma penetrans]|uniref:DUF6856 family protein n=1 Tax=Malacoplasma penetrans TaxID=28227 RepID=UPI00101274D7|nr:hypothetical protein [Malacoplasma penetrans]RXY96480.1 hypothetical protein D8X55_03685 [Malacoplasma penetrans]